MKTTRTLWIALASVSGIGALAIAALTALADTPAPVMTMTPLASNQFSITITNGVTNVNYELYWTPMLNDAAYPWQLLVEGAPLQTNFTVDGGISPIGFFQTRVGSDADGDGVPNWMDADPNNPAVGALTVIINSPTNGAVVQ
ncbi:MAG: hypothetical protein JWQ04_1222 [Pedosphaera sp.]|nr:hypothetical protein [Pedosphaera sp.]